jgi:DNA-binding LytR/AlgR family response regulator
MLRALLVDDEAPARDRLRRLLKSHPDVACVGDAPDGASALQMIDSVRPDLVFLDIQMPEMDGLAVAAAIPEGGPSVIFATAFDQHAVRAFELAAVDYLLKPIEKERLKWALDRVRERRTPASAGAHAVLQQLPNKSRKMAVRAGASYVVFEVERIAAIVAQDHYSTLLVDGRELLSDDSLDRLISRLDGSRFLRVHRSAIVNTDFVRELHQVGDRKYVAILDDPKKTRVPISREKLDELKSRFGIE